MAWPRFIEAKLARSFWRMPRDAERITLTQNRIYLLPTKRGWAFVLMLLVLLLIALNYGANLVFLLCFLFAGYMLASVLVALRQLLGLNLDFLTIAPVCLGEQLHLSVQLSAQTGREHRGLTLSYEGITSDSLTLVNTEILTLLFPSPKRGRLSIGRLMCYSTAPAGLIRAFTYLHHDWSALVYPKPETNAPMPPMVALKTGQATQKHVQQHDEAEHSGLRDYQSGDKPRDLSWQRYTRTQSLATKTADEEHSVGQELLLSYQHCGVAGHEAKLSRLCAWVYKAKHNGQAFELSLPNEAMAKSSDYHAALARLALA